MQSKEIVAVGIAARCTAGAGSMSSGARAIRERRSSKALNPYTAAAAQEILQVVQWRLSAKSADRPAEFYSCLSRAVAILTGRCQLSLQLLSTDFQ